jgi:hypothetical protein
MNTPHFRNTLIAIGVVSVFGAGGGAFASQTTTPLASMVAQDGIQPAYTHLSSDLIGATVTHPGEQDQSATLRHLVIDDEGMVTHAILGYGGTMGVGEKQFIVPFSDLTFSRSDEKLTVHTALVLEEVQEMPEFRTRAEADDDTETASQNYVTGSTSGTDKPLGESISDATDSAGAALGEATAETQRVASDTWITTKIKSAIYADSISQGFEVGVTTLHGEVVLDGDLNDQQSVDHVTNIAKGVEGVKNVDTSRLIIR